LQHDLRKSISRTSDEVVRLRTDHASHPDPICQAAQLVIGQLRTSDNSSG
jgi:hypothetical protein